MKFVFVPTSVSHHPLFLCSICLATLACNVLLIGIIFSLFCTHCPYCLEFSPAGRFNRNLRSCAEVEAFVPKSRRPSRIVEEFISLEQKDLLDIGAGTRSKRLQYIWTGDCPQKSVRGMGQLDVCRDKPLFRLREGLWGLSQAENAALWRTSQKFQVTAVVYNSLIERKVKHVCTAKDGWVQ